ncbi:MAG: hypothetical protein WAN50_04475 [Minisyncoccia bacterium]
MENFETQPKITDEGTQKKIDASALESLKSGAIKMLMDTGFGQEEIAKLLSSENDKKPLIPNNENGFKAIIKGARKYITENDKFAATTAENIVREAITDAVGSITKQIEIVKSASDRLKELGFAAQFTLEQRDNTLETAGRN